MVDRPRLVLLIMSQIRRNQLGSKSDPCQLYIQIPLVAEDLDEVLVYLRLVG